MRTAEADASGIAVVADLPPDDVVCWVRGEGWRPAQRLVPMPQADAVRVIEMTLHRAATLKGEVRPSRGGLEGPVAVRALSRDGLDDESTATDDRGNFAFASRTMKILQSSRAPVPMTPSPRAEAAIWDG